jgi:hypothetical protein
MNEEENPLTQPSARNGAEASADEEKAKIHSEETKKASEGEEDKAVPPEEKNEEAEKADDVDGTYNGAGAKNPQDFYFRPLHYVNDGTFTVDESISQSLKTYNAKMRGPRALDVVSMAVLVASFVAVLAVFLTKQPNWANYTTLGIALAVILSSFILSSVFNKKRTKTTGEWLLDYEDTVDGYLVSSLDVKDPSLAMEAKVNDHDVIEAHYFQNITSIDSRGLLIGHRNGLEFSLADVAVTVPSRTYLEACAKPESFVNLDGTDYVPSLVTQTMTGTQELPTKDVTVIDMKIDGDAKEEKRKEKDFAKADRRKAPAMTSSGLYGKFFSYGLKISSQESFIVCFLGDPKSSMVPDFLRGYQAVHVPGLRDNILVYAADVHFSSAFFTPEAVEKLNRFQPDQTVLSAFLSMNSYGTKIGLNLSDDVLTLPTKALSHIGSYDAVKKAVDALFAFVDEVGERSRK